MRRVSAEPDGAPFMQRMPARVPSLIVAGLVLLLPGCQTLDKAAAELTPYGVQLNERIAQWERACKDMKLGPYYDNNPANRNDASCDFLFLKNKHWDPEADSSADTHTRSGCRRRMTSRRRSQEGMSSGEYLKELCAKEAGEWIFRTVSNVEGVLQARTRVPNPRGSSPLMPFAQEPLVSGSADDGLGWPWEHVIRFNFAYFEYPEGAAEGASRILRFYRRRAKGSAIEPAANPYGASHMTLPSALCRRQASSRPVRLRWPGKMRPDSIPTESRLRTPGRRHQYEGSSWRSVRNFVSTQTCPGFPGSPCTRTRSATSAALSRPTRTPRSSSFACPTALKRLDKRPHDHRMTAMTDNGRAHANGRGVLPRGAPNGDELATASSLGANNYRNERTAGGTHLPSATRMTKAQIQYFHVIRGIAPPRQRRPPLLRRRHRRPQLQRQRLFRDAAARQVDRPPDALHPLDRVRRHE